MKNTIWANWAEAWCPNWCINCGETGRILCECCKKYILAEGLTCRQHCLFCEKELSDGHCEGCEDGFVAQFVVGARRGILKTAINEYKYNGRRALARELSALLCSVITGEWIIVPLPTIRAHIEGRGFDHIGLLARTMAREKHLGVAKIIKRVNASVQVGAAMVERKQQAREAYALCGEIDSGAQYLLLDDVLTTGSSIRAAAEVLRAAGAKQIGVAVIAKS